MLRSGSLIEDDNYKRRNDVLSLPVDRIVKTSLLLCFDEWKSAGYLYKWASVQFCRSKDQVGSQAGVPERQIAGPNPQKGPTNIPELL